TYQGDDQPWRREDLSARSRRRAAGAPRGRRGGDVRRPGCEVRRGGPRRRGAQGRGDGRAVTGPLPVAVGGLQGAEADSHHKGAAADGDGQGAATERCRGISETRVGWVSKKENRGCLSDHSNHRPPRNTVRGGGSTL